MNIPLFQYSLAPQALGCSRWSFGCLFAALLAISAPARGAVAVAYTSIDTMKESRDQETSSMSQTEIDQIVALCAALNVTHITVDTHWEYPSFMQKWINSVRAHGKKVYFRTHPNQWGDSNGTTGIMTPSAHNTALNSFILANPTFFQSGDIFDPCPEPENGLYWKSTYGSGWSGNSTAVAEWNAFIRSSSDTADAAFAQLGITGVDTTVRSTSPWPAANILEQATVNRNHRVTIDTYPEGTSTDPTTCANARLAEIQTVTNKWPGIPVCIGEMGYSNGVAVSDSVQNSVLQAELTAMEGLDCIGGVNYWVGPGSDTAGGHTFIMKKTNGVWSDRPAAATLSSYYADVLGLMEAESLTVAASSGDTVRVMTDSNMRGGAGSIIDADAVNDYVTYTGINVPWAGTYDLRVAVKKLNTRGIFQLAIAPSLTGTYNNHGATQDLYSSTTSYTEIDIGNVSFSSPGIKYFRFTVVGKNASSSGYSLAFDYVQLLPN